MSSLITIIIPTFNRAYILGNAIDSVIRQSYPNWELLIVDDGSSDNTKKVVESFKNNNISYFHQQNKGPSAARNLGFKHAKGEWIAYIDSDNELYPIYLERMLAATKLSPQALFLLPKGKRTLELLEGKKVVKSIDDSADFPEQLSLQEIFWRKMHFDVNGFMHSRLLIDEGFTWDAETSLMEDWDFVMQIGERHPDGFVYVTEELFHYHQRFGGDGLVSNAKYLEWIKAFEYIYQKHKNDKLLQGQDWYPNRIEKYTDLYNRELKGEGPPPYLKYFS